MLTTHAWVLVHPLYKCRWLGYLYTPVAAAGVGRKNTCLIMRTSSSHVLSVMLRRALLFWCFCTGMLSELHPCCDHCWSLCVVLFHVVFHAGWLTILVHFIEVLLEVLICWLLHQPCCQCWGSPQPLWCLHTKVLELLSSFKERMPLVEDHPDFGPCCLWQEFQLLSATVLNGLLKHIDEMLWDLISNCCQIHRSLVTPNEVVWPAEHVEDVEEPLFPVECPQLLSEQFWWHKKWLHKKRLNTRLLSTNGVDIIMRHKTCWPSRWEGSCWNKSSCKKKSYWLSQWCWYR